MPTLYRMIRDRYRHEPLSVVGSRLFGGRWNFKGTGVLYATSTPELGLIETLAHAPTVRYEDLPTYWVFSLSVPDDIRYYTRSELPDYWQDDTYDQTQYWLKDWHCSLCPSRCLWLPEPPVGWHWPKTRCCPVPTPVGQWHPTSLRWLRTVCDPAPPAREFLTRPDQTQCSPARPGQVRGLPCGSQTNRPSLRQTAVQELPASWRRQTLSQTVPADGHHRPAV